MWVFILLANENTLPLEKRPKNCFFKMLNMIISISYWTIVCNNALNDFVISMDTTIILFVECKFHMLIFVNIREIYTFLQRLKNVWQKCVALRLRVYTQRREGSWNETASVDGDADILYRVSSAVEKLANVNFIQSRIGRSPHLYSNVWQWPKDDTPAAGSLRAPN